MSNHPPIVFYFDYISSNAYLAWHALPDLARRYDRRIEPMPVLFAGLLEAHGQLGPAEIPAKSLWMWRNNVRKAALLGVPLNPPSFHPFNPLLALRVSSLPIAEDKRRALIDGLFDAVWVHGRHVSDPQVVAEIGDRIGLSGEELIDDAQQAESKVRLRQQTDDAIARGVFGVPSMSIGNEVFWGYDDFPYLELHLAGNDPIVAWEAQAHTQAIPTPSARRRRFRAP